MNIKDEMLGEPVRQRIKRRIDYCTEEEHSGQNELTDQSGEASLADLNRQASVLSNMFMRSLQQPHQTTCQPQMQPQNQGFYLPTVAFEKNQ